MSAHLFPLTSGWMKSLFPSYPEVYHQCFCVNKLVVFIGAGVLIGALKLRNIYEIILKQKLLKHCQGVLIYALPIL